MLSLNAPSLDATRAIASKIADLSRTGDIIVLAGEMGAGKTAFARFFGAALGVTEPVTSPTFTLVQSYQIDDTHTLYHADLYRLDSTAEIEDLALPELAEFGGIVLVEWGDVAAGLLGSVLEVRLDRLDDLDDLDDWPDSDRVAPVTDDGEPLDDFGLDEPRSVTIGAVGPGWTGRWERLRDSLADYAGGPQ